MPKFRMEDVDIQVDGIRAKYRQPKAKEQKPLVLQRLLATAKTRIKPPQV